MGLIGLTSFISPISHISPTSLVVRQAWEAMRILARMLSRLVFFLLLLITVIFKSPPVALALGLGFGLGFSNPYAKQTRSLSKTLLQASVVGLGFGMNLRDVLRAGSSGFVYTALGIAATMILGVALGRWLKVERTPALLIAVGTTVKLTRALWIAPMAVGTALVKRREARIQWPWFILFFCVAAMIRTWLPAGKEAFDILTEVARVGLTATLFLIGCGISKKTLRTVGARPLAQGVILWVIVGALSLALIRVGVIGL